MRSAAGVVARIPYYSLNRSNFLPGVLPLNYTFSLTTRCNSRCMTCNIWKIKTDELSLEEWEKILHSVGNSPYWITLSGGEPFLYADLVPLCKSIQQICNPAILNIPTNSLTPGIAEKVAQIASIFRPAQLILNLSLDGVGEDHDRIRGIPGNFSRFEKNLAQLNEVAREYPNLSIGIHSVISTYNIERFSTLMAYAKSQPIDQFITEMAEERVELNTMNLPISPDPVEYIQILEQLTQELSVQSGLGIARMTRAFRLEYYRLLKRTLLKKTQVIPCYAGWASAQIYADGTVWPCCIRADPLGNLRDVEYDFSKIWLNQKSQQVRASIRKKECWCTLANASYTNMLMHLPTLARAGVHVAQSFNPKRPVTK